MSEQAVIRLMHASSCFGREVCATLPCACARSLNDALGAEQDAEIARIKADLAAARQDAETCQYKYQVVQQNAERLARQCDAARQDAERMKRALEKMLDWF